MRYSVHRVDVKRETMQETREPFLNGLSGEIVAVLPDVRPTFQFMGATARVACPGSLGRRRLSRVA